MVCVCMFKLIPIVPYNGVKKWFATGGKSGPNLK